MRYRYWWDTCSIPIAYHLKFIPPANRNVSNATLNAIWWKWANGCRVVSFFETSVSGRRRLGAPNHSKVSKRLQSGAHFRNRSKPLVLSRFSGPSRHRFQENEQTAAEWCTFWVLRGLHVKIATRSVKMTGRCPKVPQDKSFKNHAFLILFGAPRDMSVKNIDLAWEWSTFH